MKSVPPDRLSYADGTMAVSREHEEPPAGLGNPWTDAPGSKTHAESSCQSKAAKSSEERKMLGTCVQPPSYHPPFTPGLKINSEPGYEVGGGGQKGDEEATAATNLGKPRVGRQPPRPRHLGNKGSCSENIKSQWRPEDGSL